MMYVILPLVTFGEHLESDIWGTGHFRHTGPAAFLMATSGLPIGVDTIEDPADPHSKPEEALIAAMELWFG